MIDEHYKTNRDALESIAMEDYEGGERGWVNANWNQEIWALKDGLYQPTGRLNLPINVDQRVIGEVYQLFTVFTKGFFGGEPNKDPIETDEKSFREGTQGYNWIDWRNTSAPMIHTECGTAELIEGVKRHIGSYFELRNKTIKGDESTQKERDLILSCYTPFE